MSYTVFFEKRIEARSPKEAYDGLIEEAFEECGTGDYNGTISTCNGYSKSALSFDKYSQDNEKEVRKYLHNKDDIGEGECQYIDLGVVRYELTKIIKKKAKKEKPVYKKKFVVYWATFSTIDGQNKKYFNILADAEKFAFEKRVEISYGNVFIKKEDVLIKGEDVVETFEKEVELVQTPPKNIPKNTAIKEIHKYLFFGWALKG